MEGVTVATHCITWYRTWRSKRQSGRLLQRVPGKSGSQCDTVRVTHTSYCTYTVRVVPSTSETQVQAVGLRTLLPTLNMLVVRNSATYITFPAPTALDAYWRIGNCENLRSLRYIAQPPTAPFPARTAHSPPTVCFTSAPFSIVWNTWRLPHTCTAPGGPCVHRPPRVPTLVHGTPGYTVLNTGHWKTTTCYLSAAWPSLVSHTFLINHTVCLPPTVQPPCVE